MANVRPDENLHRKKDSPEKRRKVAGKMLDRTKRSDLKSNQKSTSQAMTATKYFADDNVKKFQNALIAHSFCMRDLKKQGRGALFSSVEEFQKECMEYVQLCQQYEAVPLISALCTYLGIDRESLYSYSRNENNPLCQSARAMLSYCHTCLEMGATESKLNSVAYIFQAKNYFGMKDTVEVKGEVTNINKLSSVQTLTELKGQLNDEQDNLVALDKGDSLEIIDKSMVNEAVVHEDE